MEVHKPPHAEREPIREKPEGVDWNAIVRNSYLFSQGAPDTQDSIFQYLAMGPMFGRIPSSDERRDVEKRLGGYVKGITKKGNHTQRTAEDKPLRPSNFEKEVEIDFTSFENRLQQARTLTPDIREREKRVALERIVSGLKMSDSKYLLTATGRSVDESGNRDKWSSFIVDFGILHKGDGFHSWNALPEVYKELWREVLPVLQELHSEALRKIIRTYVVTHPDLSEAEIAKIEPYL